MNWRWTSRAACLVSIAVVACGHQANDAGTPATEAGSSAEEEQVLAAGPALREPLPIDEAGHAQPPAEAPSTHGLSPTFVPFDINHVLSTGQSLSVGANGSPPLSTSQPFGNLMFTSGVLAESAEDFAPLVEGDVEDVETMSSGLANHVAGAARVDPALRIDHRMLVSVHGAGATEYAGLKKGTAPYARGMEQVVGGRDRARALRKSYVVRAVTVVHGESDHYLGNTHYADDIIEWQSDYETDIKALTGQAQPVPLLHTQVSSVSNSIIPLAQLEAHVRAPGKVVLVGPKYHLPYSDGLHLTAEGYRHMGEDYAKVYRRVVLEEQPWEPVRPKTIVRSGDTITVTFHVPSPPLAIDTTLVSDPGAYGFDFTDGSTSPPRIVSVTLAGQDSVRVRLSSLPGPGARLSYARRYGATRGNLRDSDSTPSRHGYPLYNWCVHFDEPVP